MGQVERHVVRGAALVAALARVVGQGATPHDAVAQLVDDKELARKPMLGTMVDPTK